MGKILKIFIAAKGKPPTQKINVDVIANRGIVGDRYYSGEGTFSTKLKGNPKSEITFIACEEIDKFNASQEANLSYGELRRNIITQAVDLNALVGKRFKIGDIEFEGIETCEPCAHLASTVHPKVLPHLVNRAGLRAAILSSGELKTGTEFSL